MKKKTVILSALFLLAAVLAALFAGNGAISAGETLQVLLGKGSRVHNTIIYQVRIPRIIAAAATGAALSVSGYLLQSSLNNTLASPGILGINNGAGLAVLVYACFFPYQYGGKCIASFLGALIVTAGIYFLSLGAGFSRTTVVLSGVAISAFCLSLIDLIIALKPETVADRTAFQLGGFASLNSSAVGFALPFILAGLLLALLAAPSLDILMLGDDAAMGLGVNVKAYRALYILCAAVLSGAAVSMSGIIGFLGLIVPNVVRMLHHGKSRGGMALCIVLGAGFLLVCDTLSRVVVYPYEVPCGLFLNLAGAPFLVWMLFKRKKRLGTE